ncbi:TIGR03089 family protein [Parafrankia irregularis]|uniref:TIGR03089 family protein n=1 Tax=Parafrankia irregularis TaxID=795642 RepID=A0A0S4QFZ7_9ACTN|nr:MULTISPECIES: TIGR03089 family protein [Parafrankia]MBE3202903.1 AMP-binding protein [Parafrankia sp. CH37]CUU54469.1 TIGR03089 family protein [Parafrankia irregularis]
MDVRFVPAASVLRTVALPSEATTEATTQAPAAPFPGVAAALAARLTRDPGRPMVTFYDDATGERVEFSTATLDNWVAKTANLLVDTVGLAPADAVGIDLPPHWTSCVILLAAWSAGMEVQLAVSPGGPVDEREASGPDTDQHTANQHGAGEHGAGAPPRHPGVIFTSEDRLDIATALDVDEVVGLSLRPLGGRLRNAVPGVLDYAVEVPPHGDRFGPPPAPAEQSRLLGLAAAVARRDALGPEDRILTVGGPASVAGLLVATLVPLVSGASVVLCRNLDDLDPKALARRVGSERITAVDWSVPQSRTTDLPSEVRRLPAPW